MKNKKLLFVLVPLLLLCCCCSFLLFTFQDDIRSYIHLPDNAGKLEIQKYKLGFDLNENIFAYDFDSSLKQIVFLQKSRTNKDVLVKLLDTATDEVQIIYEIVRPIEDLYKFEVDDTYRVSANVHVSDVILRMDKTSGSFYVEVKDKKYFFRDFTFVSNNQDFNFNYEELKNIDIKYDEKRIKSDWLDWQGETYYTSEFSYTDDKNKFLLFQRRLFTCMDGDQNNTISFYNTTLNLGCDLEIFLPKSESFISAEGNLYLVVNNSIYKIDK